MRSKLKQKIDKFLKDKTKTDLWFKIPNSMLGGISPNQMIKAGRKEKLERLIDITLGENERE